MKVERTHEAVCLVVVALPGDPTAEVHRVGILTQDLQVPPSGVPKQLWMMGWNAREQGGQTTWSGYKSPTSPITHPQNWAVLQGDAYEALTRSIQAAAQDQVIGQTNNPPQGQLLADLCRVLTIGKVQIAGHQPVSSPDPHLSPPRRGKDPHRADSRVTHAPSGARA